MAAHNEKRLKPRRFITFLSLGLLLSCVVLFYGTQAFADSVPLSEATAQLATGTSNRDLAASWLRFLFEGNSALATSADALTSLASALRGALGVYSVSMFVIGGFLLLWQVVSMIAETAQTGVVMGRRANQLWTPIRFIIGISLLIPLGSGMNLGQHVIVKIASHGSDLATEAWQSVVQNVGTRLSTPLAPHLPDIGRVVATAMEIELCHSMYQQVYAVYQNDPIVALAGGMTELTKSPAQRLSDETWHYNNALFPDVAVCGAYSFLSPEKESARSPQGKDDKQAQAVSEVARAAVERLTYQTHAVAAQIATAFLSADQKKMGSIDIQQNLAGFVKEQTQLIEVTQNKIIGERVQNGTNSLLEASASRGWIAAGAFPFDVIRQQIALGEVSVYGLPKVKAPLLGHQVLTREAWLKAASDTSPLRLVTASQLDPYAALYDRLADGMKKARVWLYNEQMAQSEIILPDQQDLKDILSPYADSEIAHTALSRLITTGASSFGVFAAALQGQENAAQQIKANAVLPDRAYLAQPLQTLAELGRRYMAYGSWLLGMLSSALAQPATIGIALCFSLIALLFWSAGACLIFAVAFIPFFRFMAAVLAWGVSVLGAVVSLPLVALGHLYPAGDGLVGPLARRAYWMWLSLFMRPVLILFGFLGGLILFLLGVVFLNVLMFDWLSPIAFAQSQAFWILRSGLSLLYALAVLVLSNVAFRGISLFPSLLMEWINTHSTMPESLVVAGAGMETTAGQKPFLLSMMEKGGTAALNALSNTTGQAQTHKELRSHAKSRDVVSRQGQSAHFPTIHENKAAERAQASALAQAYAKIETAGGNHKVEASALAAAGNDPEHMKAMAIARHMLSLDKKAERKADDDKLLAPDDLKSLEATKKTIEKKRKEEAKTPPSPEQSAAPLDEASNPFNTKSYQPPNDLTLK